MDTVICSVLLKRWNSSARDWIVTSRMLKGAISVHFDSEISSKVLPFYDSAEVMA